MKISARCDYACKALLELSLHYGEEKPLQIQTIAENQSIPEKYLVQILIQLKGAGLVDSIRGKDGGYHLTKPPNQITFGDVIREFESLLSVNSVGKNSQRKGALEVEYVLREIWTDVQEAISNVVDNVTFQDICNKVIKSRTSLVYNI